LIKNELMLVAVADAVLFWAAEDAFADSTMSRLVFWV
jgi:hypothetical protein